MTLNDQITLFPTSLKGDINVPPSKSLSHRALICAALSDGVSEITNIIYSDDINATIEALKQLGAKFTKQSDKLIVEGTKKLKLKRKEVDCNESGSTIRFLIPIFSLTNKEVHFTGKESLIQRPQSIYKKIFDQDNNTFKVEDNKVVVKGSIKARKYIIKGNVSSQFISGLLFSLPLLDDDSTIMVDGPLESKSYVDLTIDMLDHYGIEVVEIEGGYFIEGKQSYKAKNYRVEGDFSQAAFFLVAGTLNGAIKVDDLNHESFQGDKQIINVIKDMKGKLIFTENGFVTEKSNTSSTTVDLSNCPDLGPIIALLASLSSGTTKIINAGRLRIKESDRIESTVETLLKLGANITSTKDSITITGRKSLKGDVLLDSYNDHRIAMMIAIAALRCENPIKLSNPQAVNKSYPHFFEDYVKVGGKYE